jgi:6-phosphogluconate dehydrogenase (decarboxylating)
MNSIKTVSVCGLGKLGACIAATLAARSFEVVGVDIDPEKVPKRSTKALRRSMSHYSPKLSKLDIHDFVPLSIREKPLLLMSPSLFPRPQVNQTEVFPTNFC